MLPRDSRFQKCFFECVREETLSRSSHRDNDLARLSGALATMVFIVLSVDCAGQIASVVFKARGTFVGTLCRAFPAHS